MKPAYDIHTLALLRQVLNDVLTDQKFPRSKSVSTLEVAEHILLQASRGERDLLRIKASVLSMVETASVEAA